MYTLTIVDMQEHWLNARRTSHVKNVIIENCVNEIDEAIKVNAGIVVLEFCRKDTGYAKTREEIMNKLKDYKHIVKNKDKADGSVEVLEACKENNLPMGEIRLCGVNFDECVYKTAIHLKKRQLETKVAVLTNATNYVNGCDEDFKEKGVELMGIPLYVPPQ